MFSEERLTSDQAEYVKDIIACDSKSINYDIQNKADLINYFKNGNDPDPLIVKYTYEKREGIKLERQFRIGNININGETYYVVNFDKLTFPGSSCNDLKHSTKQFK